MVETAVVLEEMGRAVFPGPYLETVVAAWAIQATGTPEQQTRWLPGIAAGDVRATVALLDADLDWQPESTRTRAELAPGGGTRLTGTKQWVPWANVADLILVPALEPDGLSVFLVESGAARLAVAPVPAMDPGMRWATVTLDAVPVPQGARLGEAGAAAAL